MLQILSDFMIEALFFYALLFPCLTQSLPIQRNLACGGMEFSFGVRDFYKQDVSSVADISLLSYKNISSALTGLMRCGCNKA